MEKIGKFELNKTHLGDTMKLAKELPDNSVDLVVTSPPYADTVTYGEGVKIMNPEEYVEWFLPLFHEAKRFLKDTGSFVLNINDRATNGEQIFYTKYICQTFLSPFL